MDQCDGHMLSDRPIEIFPPERENAFAKDSLTCPCCRRTCAASSMDEDGCGICDECLAP